MRLIVRLFLLTLCATLLGGCFSRSQRELPCTDHPGYLAAGAAAPLRTPQGLAAPNTKNALKIGEVSSPATARTTKDGCLDRPPKFFGEQAKPALAVPVPQAMPEPPAQ